MAVFTIRLPDAQLERVLMGYCGYYGYSETVPGLRGPDGTVNEVPNPETKGQFMHRMIIRHIRDCVIGYEARQAASAAAEAAGTNIDLS